jgi:hypothetical protein
MPTSKLELMELLVTTIMGLTGDDAKKQHPTQDRTAHSTYFDAPAAQVDTSNITLADLLGDQPNLLLALAASHEGADSVVSARVIRQIASFLCDPAVSIDVTEHRTRRFLDYVYPVV